MKVLNPNRYRAWMESAFEADEAIAERMRKDRMQKSEKFHLDTSWSVTYARELDRLAKLIKKKRSLSQPSADTLITLLTKGYQKYVEEINRNPCILDKLSVDSQLASLQQNVESLREELKNKIHVEWNP